MSNIRFTVATRERVDFSKIKTSIPIPNLIEVQKKSYERFLQMDLLPPNAMTRVCKASSPPFSRSPISADWPSSISSIIRSATGSASAAT